MVRRWAAIKMKLSNDRRFALYEHVSFVWIVRWWVVVFPLRFDNAHIKSCSKRIICEIAVVYRLLFFAHSISFILCQFNCVLYSIFILFHYFLIRFWCCCLCSNVCGFLCAQMCYQWMDDVVHWYNCRYNNS